MADTSQRGTTRPTLGLTGVTVNAMALIAPGAFLWITYQMQAAQAAPGGGSTMMDMWPGILLALFVAFLTALSYAELAKIYPEAGTGSCYYFAEKAFMDKSETRHQQWARIAKLVTGWAAHLFYWVYPGVMVSFFAIIVAYILGQFGLNVGVLPQMGIAIVFSAVVGFIALRGVTGSTLTSLVINVVQLTALVGFSILAISYRLINPDHVTFVHKSASSIVLPHNLMGMFMQSTLAILILVGFESATAFGSEAKNAKRDIPRAVILALVIQGIFAYLFEYFAGNFALSDGLTFKASDGSILKGVEAAAASGAPIGDMIRQIGDSMLGGFGFGLMIIVAITVVMAILGTTLSAMNTGVRITYAMAQDDEMPQPLGLLHGKYVTPHVGVVVMIIVSAIVGMIGTFGVVSLTGITLASNLGTFVLYALTCLWAFIAFVSRKDFNLLKHGIIPLLGVLANLTMLVVIFAMGFLSGGDTLKESLIAIGVAAFWGVVTLVYVLLRNRRTGRTLLQRSAQQVNVPVR